MYFFYPFLSLLYYSKRVFFNKITHICWNPSLVFNNCRTPKIDEVLWLPPLFGWFKINIDDLSKGNPGLSVATGVFEITQVLLLPLDALALDLFSELYAILLAIDFALTKVWTSFRLRVIRFQLCLALRWLLRYPCFLWINFRRILLSMKLHFSHIFHENNVRESLFQCTIFFFILSLRFNFSKSSEKLVKQSLTKSIQNKELHVIIRAFKWKDYAGTFLCNSNFIWILLLHHRENPRGRPIMMMVNVDLILNPYVNWFLSLLAIEVAFKDGQPPFKSL